MSQSIQQNFDNWCFMNPAPARLQLPLSRDSVSCGRDPRPLVPARCPDRPPRPRRSVARPVLPAPPDIPGSTHPAGLTVESWIHIERKYLCCNFSSLITILYNEVITFVFHEPIFVGAGWAQDNVVREVKVVNDLLT